jgi:hypothetical protein
MNSNQPGFDLPESLQRQFQTLERRLWWAETLWAATAVLGVVLGSLLGFFLLDRFVETPMWARWLLLLGTVGVVGLAVWWWVRRWVIRKPVWEDLAKVVQRRHRRLGDRLLGVVELTHSQDGNDAVSPALCRAAIAQVAEETASLNFTQAVELRGLRRAALVAVILVVAAGLGYVLAPTAWVNAMARWALPGSGMERFTFVEFGALPDEQVVPFGEAYELVSEVRYRSKWRPETIHARLGGNQVVEGAVAGGRISVKVPALTEPTVLRMRLGDRTETVRLVPMHRPALTGLVADIEWPDYLQKDSTEVKVDQGSLRLLEGSRAGLRGAVTRELVWARMLPEFGVGPELKKAEWSVPMTDLWNDGDALQVTWKDVLGLGNRNPLLIQIKRYADEPPRPELKEIGRAVAILPDEVLEFAMAAEDDFGIQNLETRLALFDRSANNAPIGSERIWEGIGGGPTTKSLERKVRFSPKVLGIGPGTTVLVRAQAKDYLPGREWTFSEPTQILILTLAEHSSLLREELQSLMDGVDAVVQSQEGLVAAAEELTEMSDEELSKSGTGSEMERQAREQEKASERLKELAEQASKLMEEAMRNSEMRTEQLEAMAAMAQMMQDIAQQQMQAAASQMKEGAQNPGQRRENAEEAKAQEQAALDKLRELQREMANKGDQMQARNFAGRLTEIAELQREVKERLQESFARMIGVLPENLASKDRNTLQTLSGREASAATEAHRIQGEMKAFAARVTGKAYEEVAKEMAEKGAPGALQKLGELVATNQSGSAMQKAEEWGETFAEWAKKLGQAADEMSSGGGGGGGGSMSPEMMELMMKMAKLRQQQQMLKSETQATDEQVKDPSERQERSQSLAERQSQLEKEMKELAQKIPSQLQEMGGQIEEAMRDAAAGLAANDLSEETAGAQAAAIELLSQMMMSPQMGGGGGMMAMMGGGGGSGASAGGNPSQSESGLPGEGGGGVAEGVPTGARSGDRASGGGGREWPAEYRDALEGYFQAVTKEGL